MTVQGALALDERFSLDAATGHYLGQVLRLADGDSLDVIDGTGALWSTTLHFEGATAWVNPNSRAPDHDEPPLVLVAALLKQSAWELVLEKATELGVTAIQPWEAARSVVKVPAAKRVSKLQRWQKICDGATRQSEQRWRVDVREPATLADVLQSLQVSQWVVLDEGHRTGAWAALKTELPTALVVGPEGGFTEVERAILASCGAQVVGLGEAILRAETACIAGLSAFRLRRAGLL